MLSVTAVPGLADDGDRIHARVDLGSAYQPTGRVSFSLFPPNDSSCSGAPTYVEEVVLTGTGATTSGGFEVPKHAVGTWNWTASYSGDENNAQVGVELRAGAGGGREEDQEGEVAAPSRGRSNPPAPVALGAFGRPG